MDNSELNLRIFKVYDIRTKMEKLMVLKGAGVVKRMEDGSDLDAVLMRFNLPAKIMAKTRLDGIWCQVAERISCSEDAMPLWKVVSSDEAFYHDMNAEIKRITDRYVSSGCAHYGE